MGATTVVKLTLDGATYTLSSSPLVLLGYVLVEAETGEETVTESIRLYIGPGSVSTTQTWLRNLADFFSVCRQRAEDGGTPGYVEVELANTTGFWRSPVLDGRLVYDEGALRYLGNGGLEVTVVLSRLGYWEGAEAEATSGATTVNNYAVFEGASNRLTLGSTAVTGALPTPPRIEITNNNGVSLNIGDIFVGANSWTPDLNAVAHAIEFESLAGGVVSDATCSAGERKDYTLASSWGTVGTYGKGTLPGRRYVAMLRTGVSPPANTYAQVLIQDINGVAILHEGSPVLLDGQLAALGSFVLPPGLIGQSGVAAIGVTFRAKGSGTLRLDFMHLMPADSFLVLRLVRQSSFYGTAANDAVVWDGMERQAWRSVASGVGAGKQPLVGWQGGIMLIPGRVQHLYFLMRFMDKTHVITRNMSVRVYYRPRRLAL
jgi:hypothetical protein